ncbi:MAG: hypothetical protein ACPGVG_15160, partial [Mycobacterium sp.]
MTGQLKRNPATVGDKSNPARPAISTLRDFQSLSDIREEWTELVRTARLGSPFAHPAWSLTWAEHFVPEGDLECVAVR